MTADLPADLDAAGRMTRDVGCWEDERRQGADRKVPLGRRQDDGLFVRVSNVVHQAAIAQPGEERDENYRDDANDPCDGLIPFCLAVPCPDLSQE